ncbi:hypothetical protein [Halomonas sp. WWR20]
MILIRIFIDMQPLVKYRNTDLAIAVNAVANIDKVSEIATVIEINGAARQRGFA